MLAHPLVLPQPLYLYLRLRAPLLAPGRLRRVIQARVHWCLLCR
jgi:hypothetical protein